jgi:antitoxin ParD1/3/4
VLIPTRSRPPFRFEVAHRSDLKPPTIPGLNRPGGVGVDGGMDEIIIGNLCQARYSSLVKRRYAMPTRNVNLTDDQDAFVERMVKAGKYQNASEAMRDAVRGLQQRWKEDELKLTALRKQIRAGAEALDRGDFIEIDDADLDATLDKLASN